MKKTLAKLAAVIFLLSVGSAVFADIESSDFALPNPNIDSYFGGSSYLNLNNIGAGSDGSSVGSGGTGVSGESGIGESSNSINSNYTLGASTDDGTVQLQSDSGFSTYMQSAFTPTVNNVPTVQSGGGVYHLLEKVPLMSLTPNLNEYVQGLFRFIFGAAAILAVLALVVAGIEYIGSSTVTSKGDARNQLTAVAVGGAIALSSYMILQTINPNLVNFNVVIPKIDKNTSGEPLISLGGTGTTPPPTTYNGTTYSQGERDIRDRLQAMGITANSGISVENLGLPAQADLMYLKKNCPQCEIVVTGGTEVGHIGHGPGLNVFDLQSNQSLEQNILQRYGHRTDIFFAGKQTYGYNVPVMSSEGQQIAISQFAWEEEGTTPHWHVRVTDTSITQ